MKKASILALTMLCALCLGGCGFHMEIKDGCSIIVSGISKEEAQELIGQLEISRECRIKIKSEEANEYHK